ncbi:Predicted N-acyltransferase, GNAT family [Paenibacillaceae bacterium GAS479]|nr:Predicted N-acyltransferase, GNAT family [Paenibacillaceae bacterium GAS479]
MLQAVEVTTQEQLDQCLAIRREVFVGEQGVSPDEEWDHYDESPQSCTHILLLDDGNPVGAGRLKPFGDGNAKLQRIAVLASCRGKGAGSHIVRAMEEAARKAGFKGSILDAQCQAKPFYVKLGYVPVSPDIFLDAGIPHIRMGRSWA